MYRCYIVSFAARLQLTLVFFAGQDVSVNARFLCKYNCL